ncbi:hypothetical protein NEOLEDRAFT_1154061 [Neolentinus lepideus HHB14362 ss-1]|uniref:Uncharacterized protein n=1 Tax=Neolentinus lepideus HHB14362 ss-1 TaxID=1314782 RepID=A0A165V0H3_9AGAM|nr:hypothetical protein NEOLEDRAFT_1154061 [Neolentinus lepideus HHB14362 ss-1]
MSSSLKKSASNPALTGRREENAPSGPLSGPSSTIWRRQRLLNIGTTSPAATDSTERTALGEDLHNTTYGTLSPQARLSQKPDFRTRRRLPALPGLRIGKVSVSNPVSPVRSPISGARDFSSFFHLPSKRQRPISAYDAPLASNQADGTKEEGDVRTNGVRVWYSSYTSIDWLHDAIKDSVRRSRLRKRRSLRGRIHNQLDRSLGWIVVTIVGFLTAIIAFLIVRGEQWLFDLKEGFCRDSWWKAKRFCCPTQETDDFTLTYVFSFNGTGSEDNCASWRTWADVFGPAVANGGRAIGLETEMVEYIAYTCVALVLALISALLTINLTASNTFSTRKDSGVLGPSFDDRKQNEVPAATEPKRKVLYYAAGSGIPEIKTILSGFVIHGYLGGRTLFTKSVGLALSVASGLSLGKEGPFVHIASCVGNIVSRYFLKYETNEGKRREILSAAAAAGVAVAFGAPIGGTLFSLEEVSYFFPPKVMWRSFFCAMIAAITLRLLNPFGTGKLVLLQVTYDKDWHAYELLFFLFLGVFGGVYGAYFSKLNYKWTRHIRNGTWLKTHPISEVLLVTLVTALLSFLNPFTRMGGTELVYDLFVECHSGNANAHGGLCVLDPPKQAWPVIKAIATAFVVKGALTIVTFGIKVPAGIFIPTLGVGACAGRIMGILVQWLQFKYPQSRVFAVCHGDLDCVIPGLYAMVGAAAALAGATRTTVSLAVIMFELTDTLTYAVPVMLSVLVAKTVADAIEPKGIYDLVIELSQLPYLDAKHNHIWEELQVDDVTDRDVDIIRADRQNTVESLRDKLQDLLSIGYDDGGFPILRKVDSESDGLRMIGWIGANELEHALSIVAESADHPVSFRTSQTYQHGDLAASSVSFSSFVENGSAVDPFDFSVYTDQAPLTVQSNAPLELVQEFFVKLGAKYVVVTDTEGFYEGVIDKKTWLAFLEGLGHKS